MRKIHVENLWKRYGLPIRPVMRQAARRITGRPPLALEENGPWALKDVSFSVEAGETLGIVGRNGSGKSTLLKVLAGVSPVTRGNVLLEGRVFPMIELNSGMNTELSGRENIYLLGSIMGVPAQRMKALYPQIVDFSELGAWLDEPVWKYSSGMRARLGFGVAMNVDASVLLIDEVLAVGDMAFKRKCFGRIESLSKNGTAIVFVSHNIRQIERICDRALYLDQGEIRAIGRPTEVTYRYSSDLLSDEFTQKLAFAESAQWEDSGELHITDIDILDEHGQPRDEFQLHDHLRIRVHYDALEPIAAPYVGFSLYTSDMIRVIDLTNAALPDRAHWVLAGKGSLIIDVPRIPFLPDVYTIGLTIKAENGRYAYRGYHLKTFRLVNSPEALTSHGLIHLDHTWQLTTDADTSRILDDSVAATG